MPQPNDLSRSLVALDQNSTIIAVVEMSQSSWLVAGMLPGIERQPRQKLEPSPERLLALLHRWQDEAVRAGRTITRIAVAFEAGRDGFWLARWLEARGVEAHVIHASSIAVSREHRRAKTDRLDTELLKRGFLGWLRGERGHCSMARVPTISEEDAKRPNRERECLVGERTRIVNRIKSTLARLGIRNFKPTLRKAAERLARVHTPEGMPLPPNTLAELQRDMARLGFVVSQIREAEEARQKRLEQQHETGPHTMVRRLARIVGVGVETADLLVHELLSRPMRDRRAVARYAGLTGSPDESGAQRREQGLARAGNARVRRGMIQLAWRFLMFQKSSAGVSYNKFLAKLASDHRKPDGLFVITPKMGAEFVETLPIRNFHGVGPATAAKMGRLGIKTGLDLRSQTLAFLQQHFGKAGCYYYWAARGIDERPVRADRIRKSVGAENTFPADLFTYEAARDALREATLGLQLERVRAAQPYGVRVEVWFQDEARIGQKNSLTRVWGQTGSRPAVPKDLGFASAYVFGAVCPLEGKAAGLIMPICNTLAMNHHLCEISSQVAANAHAVVILDGVGPVGT